MRALPALLALSLLVAVPAAAQAPSQTPTFLKVDISQKSGRHHDGPTEIHVRLPMAMARGLLDVAGQTEVKVNGKAGKELKLDQLVKLLETARPGDLLLEITTDKGDRVKIAVE